MTDQRVDKSDNVVQVAGSVTVNNQYGLAVSEVRELAHIFMRENMPALREEAMAAARDNVACFISAFEEKLSTSGHKIDAEKFKDPDVQSSFNDAVIEAAKKGKRSNIDLLNDLLIERVSAENSNFVSLVAAEAIKVVPRLMPAQIAFLNLVHFTKYTKSASATSLDDLVPFASDVLALSAPGFGLSQSQKSHLEFVGCVTIAGFLKNSATAIWKASYGFLAETSEEDLKSTIASSYPVLNELAEAFRRENVSHITLTSVGQLIALSNLSRRVPNLDYSNWLN